jgi:hypothetical protein
VKFLARQGLPLRGHGDDSDSNFIQLYKLCGQNDPKVLEWLKKKRDKYTSGEIQNEVIMVMALKILRQIAATLHESQFYTIMVDETADVSNKEQVVICIRWVSKNFDVHEEFIGLYVVDKIDAQTLVAVIKDVLHRLNISVVKLRGQCYDGAASMAGSRSGVAKMILNEEPRALYTHCYGHALNLACGDTIKRSKIMKDALDIVYEISKLIKKSPRRDAIFSKLKQEVAPASPGVRVLCPTRWTVRADALHSIIENYEVLNQLWIQSLEVVNDTEMKARILGVSSQMKSFSFFFGVCLGKLILSHSDNLSSTLQKSDISAAEGQAVAAMTVKTLSSIRSHQCFDQFWGKMTKRAGDLGVNDPLLPRQRKTPRRFETGSSDSHTYPETPKDYYKPIYFEAIDLITTCISDRFNQPGYNIYRNIEIVLLNAVNSKEYKSELDTVVNFYGSDFNAQLLETQLHILSTSFTKEPGKVAVILDVIKYFKEITQAQKELMCEVCKLLTILLVMPASNAVSERSFSALRRVKTYLRSTMTQNRLNNLMVLHIHKENTDSMDIISVANDFVSRSEHRCSIFGTFNSCDLSP